MNNAIYQSLEITSKKNVLVNTPTEEKIDIQ